ncbi:calcium/calmodulin-dependent protein kinase [Mycena amicta]|nr:calcium/calmodulin-dependent protein kinase [Mycena amicta]
MPGIPCQYACGKVLGAGAFGIVREATHIRTGRVYACKSIDKAELAHNPNIAVLRDYFETRDHLYLCFDQYGVALIDRVKDRGHFTEVQTVDIMRTVLAALKTIHAAGIVHHDLKPDNLLFRNTNERTNEVMIVDFGLSQCVGERNGYQLERQRMLTAIVGTEGYMAPEIYLNGGHGKPVDMWAMGVIAYFLLSGRRPFSRATAAEERAAVISDGYEFEPEKLWDEISDEACHFVAGCLLKNPSRRTTAGQALEHEWLDSQAIVPPTVIGSPIPRVVSHVPIASAPASCSGRVEVFDISPPPLSVAISPPPHKNGASRRSAVLAIPRAKVRQKDEVENEFAIRPQLSRV